MSDADSGSRRYLALWFPFLCAERLRNRSAAAPDARAPFALVEKVRGALRLAAVDAVAARLGLEPGLALADARARVPDLAVAEHDPLADLAWLEAIADGCVRYTPMVAVDAPDGLLLDIAGCEHLFGGEAALAAEVTER
ncbi:MAG: DNA polymerase Y family protein, partial [Sphingomonas bacterium]